TLRQGPRRAVVSRLDARIVAAVGTGQGGRTKCWVLSSATRPDPQDESGQVENALVPLRLWARPHRQILLGPFVDIASTPHRSSREPGRGRREVLAACPAPSRVARDAKPLR